MIFSVDGLDRVGKTTVIQQLNGMVTLQFGNLNTSYKPVNVLRAIERREIHSQPFFEAIYQDIRLLDLDQNECVILDRAYLTSMVYGLDPSIISSNGTNASTLLNYHFEHGLRHPLESLRNKILTFVITNNGYSNIGIMHKKSDFNDNNVDFYERRFINWDVYFKYQEVFNSSAKLDNVYGIELFDNYNRLKDYYQLATEIFKLMKVRLGR